MSQRLDVRRMLLKRGWDEAEFNLLKKGPASWAGWPPYGDSSASGPRGTVEFPGGTPARAIVAFCEELARTP